MHSFSSLYNENTVKSKEYPGPLDFDITRVDCIYKSLYSTPSLIRTGDFINISNKSEKIINIGVL